MCRDLRSWILLSFEVEWFDSPYPMIGGAFMMEALHRCHRMSTIPFGMTFTKTKTILNGRCILKKSFSKFDFIGIAANDHTIYNTFDAEGAIEHRTVVAKTKRLALVYKIAI